jgi:hypothetical protein
VCQMPRSRPGFPRSRTAVRDFAERSRARQTNPRFWAKIVLPNMILRSAVPHLRSAFHRLLIVTGLAAHSRSFYHLNLRATVPLDPRPAPGQALAEAKAERPAAVFRDIAIALIPIAAGALRRQSEALIRLLDATPIPLKPAPGMNRETSVLRGPRLVPAPAASNCTCSTTRGSADQCGSK